MRIAVGCLLALLVPAPAVAESEIPTYDVKGLCMHEASRMMSITHEVSQSVLKNCYQEQQQAYNSVKRMWKVVPADIRSKDDAIARSPNASGGYGNYSVLASLVELDMGKLKDTTENRDFKLRR